MHKMISETYRLRGENVDISKWDVSKVKDLSNFVESHADLQREISTYLFNADISKWNTESATKMDSMFYNQDIFNADISNWNVEKVTSMSNMFAWTTDDFNVDISCWNTSQVNTFQSTFSHSYEFDQGIFFVSFSFQEQNLTHTFKKQICQLGMWRV